MWLLLPQPTWIGSRAELVPIMREIEKRGLVAIDTETTGLDIRKERVLIWSLCYEEKSRFCLPVEALPWFKPIWSNPNVTKLFTNAKFDKHMLANTGTEIQGPLYDTLVMDWMHDENRRHGLKDCALDHLHLESGNFKDTFKLQRGQNPGAAVLKLLAEDKQAAVDYASRDAWMTWSLLQHHYLPRLQAERSETTGYTLWQLYTDVEVPFTSCLWNCERRGFTIDLGHMTDLVQPLQTSLRGYERYFAKLAGKEVNLNSPVQMRDLFFGKLGMTPFRYSKGGKTGDRQPSVDQESLEEWEDRGHEPSEKLLEYRVDKTILSRYVGEDEESGLRQWVDDDLRIHSKLNQHVTVTGRLSSADPNLQNIPKPDHDRYQLRKAFIPDPFRDDMTLLVGDYAQLEMRILAHFCQDQNFIDTIMSGDVHIGTASKVYGVPYGEIEAAKKSTKGRDPLDWTDQEQSLMFMREVAKIVGFGQPNRPN